jgi:broad specificity phosphatase PhoE
MAILMKDPNNFLWCFKHGKYQGKTIEEVAEEDPGYLRWVHDKATDDLSDEAFYELEDTMEKFNIEPK